MEFISRVSAHAGRNRELYLSAHGRLPGTLRYTCTPVRGTRGYVYTCTNISLAFTVQAVL